MVKRNSVQIVKIMINNESIEAKKCTACFETKPLYEFHAKKSSVGGRNPRCKVCRGKEENERYRSKNPIIQKQYRWKKDEIICWIRESFDNGEDISVTAVKRKYPGMTRACEKRYGGWRKMVELSGINYEDVSKVKFWNDEEILSEIRKIYQEEGRINQGYVFGYRKGFISTALNRFGSWKNAVESAGLSFEDIKEDKRVAQECGKKFENVLEGILKEIGSGYERFYQTSRNGYVPDFTKNEHWLDAKFSEWSMNLHATRNKYESKCKSLTIVYMRGTKNRDDKVSGKTRVMSVHKLIKQLPKHRQKYYNLMLKDIESNLHIEVGNE